MHAQPMCTAQDGPAGAAPALQPRRVGLRPFLKGLMGRLPLSWGSSCA